MNTDHKPRILVIGDIILDHDVRLKTVHESPEGVPVRYHEGADLRLGGAGAVAVMAAELGAEVYLSGIVGYSQWDLPQALVLQRLEEFGVDGSGIVVVDRPQTVKTRYFFDGKQEFRVDIEECTPIGKRVLSEIIERMPPEVDVVLVADYAKGVVCGLLTEILQEKHHHTTIIVDPARGRGPDWYPCACCICPNRTEWKGQDWSKFRGVIVRKCDRDGIYYSMNREYRPFANAVSGSRTWNWCPSIVSEHDVVDTCGAGDMILAALGAFLGSGKLWPEAVMLANAAAGLKCLKAGAVPVKRDDVFKAVHNTGIPVRLADPVPEFPRPIEEAESEDPPEADRPEDDIGPDLTLAGGWGGSDDSLDDFPPSRHTLLTPGFRTALRRYPHRSRKILCRSGEITVELMDDDNIAEAFRLPAGEETSVPLNLWHRVSNLGDVDAVFCEIEVPDIRGDSGLRPTPCEIREAEGPVPQHFREFVQRSLTMTAGTANARQ